MAGQLPRDTVFLKIVRAWKDEAFRQSLSNAEQAQLPTNPAGLLELTDEALEVLIASGGVLVGSCLATSCPIDEVNSTSV